MRINNNIMAMNTHRQYGINNANVSKSVEKLSSGYRINRAGDDAAGLAISEKMRAQIRGLSMASKNSQDAISLVQTAEGALQESHNILQRMRELAVQSASDTNEPTIDRDALNKEFQALMAEIDDTASKAKFNDMGLIDGSFSAFKINNANNTYSGTTPTAQAILDALTVGASATGTGQVAVTVNKTAPGAAPSGGAGTAPTLAASTAESGVAGVRTSGGLSAGGISDITQTWTDDATADASDSKLNGTWKISSANGVFTATLLDADAQPTSTTITGTFDTTGGGENDASSLAQNEYVDVKFAGLGTLKLTSTNAVANTGIADAADVVYGNVVVTGSKSATDALGSDLNAAGLTFAADPAGVTKGADMNGEWKFSWSTDKFVATNGSKSIDGVVKGGVDPTTLAQDATLEIYFEGLGTLSVKNNHTGAEDVTGASFTGGVIATGGSDTGGTGGTGGTAGSATVTFGSEVYKLSAGQTKLQLSNGAVIEFAAIANDFSNVDEIFGLTEDATGNIVNGAFTIDYAIEQGIEFVVQTGANKGDELAINIDKMDAKTLGVYASHVASREASSNAIEEVNDAINKVSTQRAALGALQNRLEHKIANLDTSAENLQAAEARIRDLDMAQEMTAFTRNNILSQAATAMLAQANSLPQGVLQLLR